MLQSTFQEIKAWPPVYKILAVVGLLLILAERIWFLNRIPEHIDEVYTFNTFTYPGIWESISFYPLPNNHVFFSVITAVFYHLTGNAFWSLRLPALLISLVVTVYAFFKFYRYTSFPVALAGVCLFCFSHQSILYSFEARGYFLVTGFALLAAFSVLDFIRKPNKTKLIWFILAAAFGFFTIPVFLYPFLSISAFGAITLLIENRKQHFWQFIGSTVLAGILTLILYLPVFLRNGIKAVIGNKYVVPVKFEAFQKIFWHWLAGTENSLIGREPNGYLLAAFLLISLLLIFGKCLSRKGKTAFINPDIQLVFLLLCFLLVPLICLPIQRVLPPVRVWLYLSIFQFFGLAWVFQMLLFRVKAYRFQNAIFIIICLVYCLHQARVLRQHVQVVNRYTSFLSFGDLMEAQKPKLIYVQDLYYAYTTKYAFLSKKLPPVKIESGKYDPEIPYEYVLFNRSVPVPESLKQKGYCQFYQDVSVVAFKKCR